ncbi:nitroreductase/quinone reductase family protein [Streptomyces aidingensis]|uniref:Deazaflavin-dependent oxidoreductase, nitroreductase family n=1 Tax=Streptomyces aidingensis TaxID=910347 RepID=A0A1I1MW30_9ACTN|nr:nitroreductase/quinone reductase family protein [Streptomyces aidingensis]SFC89365.1 deazaflavin-dependent oxidoreductase, nitroreductase family [Streptomyces aidingensis]
MRRGPYSAVRRRLYRGGRPRPVARRIDRLTAAWHAGALSPGNWVTLEVPGRRSGRTITFPVVVADYRGAGYLVSMLGQNANWVRNVRAADGRAVLRKRGRRAVRLHEVGPADRAPILRRYLEVAPGARPHFPVDRHAPVADFARIAARYPVFRLGPREPRGPGGPSLPGTRDGRAHGAAGP